jgi:hypothetical protein
MTKVRKPAPKELRDHPEWTSIRVFDRQTDEGMCETADDHYFDSTGECVICGAREKSRANEAH